jgi:hypothetical protein
VRLLKSDSQLQNSEPDLGQRIDIVRFWHAARKFASESKQAWTGLWLGFSCSGICQIPSFAAANGMLK